uniref:ATP synthase F0 subunit 8 n=1 Tax=Afurcagobius suppositus TaxID=3112639 RepID=UPI0030038B41|nr:ATP synthase F0 subunit 8 [Afurcagobius suppositus]
MPQLILAPWFYIFVLSWLVLLIIVVPKALSHTFPNSPTTQSTKQTKTPSWTWPWL